MKNKEYLLKQSIYFTPWTAIAREQKQFIKIAFAVHLSAVIYEERYRSESGALKSAVFNFVFFVMLKNKIEQSAAQRCLRPFELRVLPFGKTSGTKLLNLLNRPTDRTFENRRSRYKEPSKNKAEAYLVYVEHLFLCSDAGDARIFSKEEDVYGTDYGFGLDAPKETEQTNPQDLFAYRRNYTWNERNLLTKSSDRNFTVHYRYGDDGQRALKYTDEGRSETLYFNNFFTIHIPTQDQNNPQGLRVHKHIFVGNSRLVTAMTHIDNYGDNEEQKVKRYYYHSDHLGSAQFVTDWKGRQYEHIEYTPYGELWIEEVAAGLDKLPFRFTGKELDEETGLYYYGARYLDPKYSRWLSGDPALNDYMAGSSVGEGGIYNTVNFNVYHYGGNNPIKYVDPTGEWVHIALGSVIGAAISGISTLSAGGSTRDVVASLIGGAVAGGMAAATGGVSLGVTVVGSALAASTGYVVESIVAGREATIDGIVNSAAGGATGAMAGAILDKAISSISSAVSKIAGSGKNTSNTKTYQTYTKTNPTTGEVYSGRTSGKDNPYMNVQKRDINYHMNKKGFGPAVLDKSSTNAAAIRGREQQLINMYGGAKSMGGSSGNAINGISQNNSNRLYYINQANKEF